MIQKRLRADQKGRRVVDIEKKGGRRAPHRSLIPQNRAEDTAAAAFSKKQGDFLTARNNLEQSSREAEEIGQLQLLLLPLLLQRPLRKKKGP